MIEPPTLAAPAPALTDPALLSLARVFAQDAATLHLWRPDLARLVCRRGAAFTAIDAIEILPLGRLGNHIIALANAIAIAQRHGIGAIHIQRLALAAEFGTPPVFALGETILHDRAPAPEEHTTLLLSRCFFLWAFRGTGGPPFRRAMIQGADYPAIVQGPVRALLARLRTDAVAPSALVMHVRSGDIFGPAPRADYGQPPLAHYLASLDHAAAQAPVSEVVVVFEDRANPVVDALDAALRARGVAHRMVSGALCEDASVIVSARRVVAGFGTFVPSLASLSGAATDLYFFRGTESAGLFRPGAVRFWQVTDTAGGFIAPNAWRNTAEQRQAMIDYPLAALAVTAAGAAREPRR